MGEDIRLRAVVGLAQAMAAVHASPRPDVPERPLRAAAHAAAEGARAALHGSFAAVSVWERDRGRLRVLANVGERAGDEEEYPEDESYPVHDFPDLARLPEPPGPDTRFPQEEGAEGPPPAWVETPEGPVLPLERTKNGEIAGDIPAGAIPPDAGHPPTARARADALRRRGRGCCLVAPIVVHGRIWGELYVARGQGEPVFTAEDAEFATVLSAVAAAGVAQNQQLERVRRLAFTDPLTGLANRRAVDAALDEGMGGHRRLGTVVSLVVCDINGLKRVNDEYGHDAGDRLLERFGSMLSLSGARLPGTLAARLGGDEFCLVAVGPAADEVARVAHEVCAQAGELGFGEGVACGVASTGDPVGSVRSARRLFRLADAAQYRAKAARARTPVVAGRAAVGAADPVVRLADTPAHPGPERRRIRGRGNDGRPGPHRNNGRDPRRENGRSDGRDPARDGSPDNHRGGHRDNGRNAERPG